MKKQLATFQAALIAFAALAPISMAPTPFIIATSLIAYPTLPATAFATVALVTSSNPDLAPIVTLSTSFNHKTMSKTRPAAQGD